MNVKPVPDGYSTITPYLVVKGCADAIDWYKRVLGAEEISRMPGPDNNTVMHAELRIGSSVVMLCDEFPNMNALSPATIGNTPVSLFCYVEDCDAVYNKAVAEGAQANVPLADQFWGDRMGRVIDPFGHVWCICTHKEDLSPEEIQKRQGAAAKG